MDKNILNLMFTWKGSINSREFRVGLCILFAAVFASFAITYSYTLYTFIFAKLSIDVDMYSFTLLNQAVWAFSPTFIPLTFILTYSAIVLAVKRMRAIGAPCGWCISSGVLNYLFFAAITASSRFGMFRYGDGLSRFNNNPERFDWLLYLLALILIAGIVNVVVLGIRRDEQLPRLNLFARTLDPQTYALQTGNLQAISVTVAFFMGILMVVMYLLDGVNSVTANFLLALLGLLSTAALIYNIILMIRRLRDTAYSPAWIAVVLGGYVLVAGLIIITTFFWTPYIVSVFPIIMQIMIAFQFVLFILPTKQTGNNNPV